MKPRATEIRAGSPDRESKTTEEWYREWFGREYLALYPHRDESEAQRFSLLLQNWLELPDGARVLDVACGSGRLSRALTSLGYRVAGIDLSSWLLSDFQAHGPSESPIPIVRGDMRQLPFGTRFDLVVSFFTSFGYFTKEEDDAATLREMARVLSDGGRLVLDFLNPEHIRKHLVARETGERGGRLVEQFRRIDDTRRRVIKVIRIKEDDTWREFRESVRMYSPSEMGRLFQAVGLELYRVAGGYDGESFSDSSSRTIYFGMRRRQ